MEQLGLDPKYLGWNLSTRFNSGDARITGVEFNFRHSLRNAGRWGKYFTVFSNPTQLRFEGNPYASFSSFIPKTANWGVSYNWQRISVIAKWNYRGLPEPATYGRMPLNLKELRLLKEHFRGSVCVAGRVAAPFSAVALGLGVEDALMLMLDDPPVFRDWIAWAELCSEVWIQAQIEAGTDALWIGDCIATSKSISLGRSRDFALEPAAHTTAQVNRLGAFSRIEISEMLHR